MPVTKKADGWYWEIPNYSAYFATSDGKIYRKERVESYTTSQTNRIVSRHLRERECVPCFNKDGYHVVGMTSDDGRHQTNLVHRIVLMAFRGLPTVELNTGCHIDGNKVNNTPDNLYWGTPQTNSDDMLRQGTRLLGHNHPASKLSESDVQAIKRHPKYRGYRRDLAEKYNVSISCIKKIRGGQTHAST